MLLVGSLNVFLVLDFLAVVKGLRDLNSPIIQVLFHSVDLDCLSVLLVHLCHVELSFSINVLEVA